MSDAVSATTRGTPVSATRFPWVRQRCPEPTPSNSSSNDEPLDSTPATSTPEPPKPAPVLTENTAATAEPVARKPQNSDLEELAESLVAMQQVHTTNLLLSLTSVALIFI